MIGPHLLVNSMSIVTFLTKPPMLRLLVRDIKRPVYHLVFVRRMCRAVCATFGDTHATVDILEELLEDSEQSLVELFVYADLLVSFAVIVHVIFLAKRRS